MVITAALTETLTMLAQAAQGAKDPWWVIGSAAVALHGRDVSNVKDVDLMMSARDADAFLCRVGGEPGGVEPNERFRSKVFGVWKRPPIPVEAFGGFTLLMDGAWREVSFSTRERVTVGDAQLYVPSAKELIWLLRLFGRAKDLERVGLLRA